MVFDAMDYFEEKELATHFILVGARPDDYLEDIKHFPLKNNITLLSSRLLTRLKTLPNITMKLML